MSIQLKRYQVDAFAEKLFTGNPAVVCPLDSWLSDHQMQSIAMENNLAETAFYVNEKEGLRIRWFTPTVEVDLCGHATLATAYILFFHENYQNDKIVFNSRSGPLTVTKSGELITLNFPADVFKEVPAIPELEEGLAVKPLITFKGKTDYLLVFEKEEIIREMKPDFKEIAQVKARGIIVTAKGDTLDFVSRFFGPQSGGDEDPVTGSAHTTLTPYWASVLNKTEFQAAQLSTRGGRLHCKLVANRVAISGKAKLFSTGIIFLE
jgi:PhzF family phenazine biosynthesis protein